MANAEIPDDPEFGNEVAYKTFFYTMVTAVLFIGIVFVFILA